MIDLSTWTESDQIAVWANHIQHALPVLPVPLLSPDPDAPLPLRQALDMCYERGMYQLSIDYKSVPPPPDFSKEVKQWMQELLTVQAS